MLSGLPIGTRSLKRQGHGRNRGRTSPGRPRRRRGVVYAAAPAANAAQGRAI